jgi:hypothetical protein
MIYFVEAIDTQHIKIGFTDMPMETRLSNLQTGNSSQLRVLGTKSGTKAEEEQLIEWFKERSKKKYCSIRGEWFNAHDDLKQYIREHTQQFRTIEYLDKLYGKLFTGSDIPKLGLRESHDLFYISADLFDESSPIKYHVSSPYDYRGWVMWCNNKNEKIIDILVEYNGKIVRVFSNEYELLKMRSGDFQFLGDDYRLYLL